MTDSKLMAEIKKDAKRYQWLRSQADGTPFIVIDAWQPATDQDMLTGITLDAYIDKHILSRKKS